MTFLSRHYKQPNPTVVASEAEGKAKQSITQIITGLPRAKALATTMAGAAIILALSTLLTGIWQTTVQMCNADQLVDPWLLNKTPFWNIIWPGSHTFLLKWPYLWLSGLGGRYSIAIATVLLYCATIAGIALFLRYFAQIQIKMLVENGKIKPENGSKVANTAISITYLLFAAFLAFIPAQTDIGTLNPIGMSMLTTRNIEYVLFILSFVLLFRTRNLQLRHAKNPLAKWFIAIAFLMIASDRLFIPMYFGGLLFWGMIRLIQERFKSTLVRATNIRKYITSLGILTLIVIVTFALTELLNFTGIMHFPVEGGNDLVPYNLENSTADLAYAFDKAVKSILLVTGCNTGTFINLFNLGILILAFIGYLHLIYRNLAKKQALTPLDTLIHVLFGAFLTTLAAFLFTKHNYINDARYLQILLLWEIFYLLRMLIYIVGRALTRKTPTNQEQNIELVKPQNKPPWAKFGAKTKTTLQIIGSGVLIVNLIIGLCFQYNIDKDQGDFYKFRTIKDQTVVNYINWSDLPTTVVGDYWRVQNIASLQSNINPIPINNCGRAIRGNLILEPTKHFDFDKSSYVYLFPNDHTELAGFYQCTHEEIIANIGEPTEEIPLNFTGDGEPGELLLVYRR